MLRTHSHVLEAHGMRPVSMKDAIEALEEAKARMPAAVIVDLVMTGMSGLEFVSRLRMHYGRACPPVILVSAHHAQVSPLEQLMFDVIMPKPYAIDRLVQTTRRLARQHAERLQSPSGVRSKSTARRPEDEQDGSS